MLALVIGFYLLIGFICAVIFEIQHGGSKYYDEIFEPLGWLFFWPLGLFSKAFGASIQFCIHRYYGFQDWRLKRAAKTVIHHPAL